MEPKVCIALGGGAARGLAHLGVLKILEDAHIPVHLIAGTSLGALIGGLYAAQPDASYWMARVEQFLRSFRSRKTRLEFIRRVEQQGSNKRGFFSDMANMIRKGFFWGVTATKPAFISAAEYADFINPLIPDIRIEETKIPFSCVATDIRNGDRVLYRSGPLRRAIGASCALPGIFPPVPDGGRLLVDGGWVERVPVPSGREMGADVIVAVDVSTKMEPFTGGTGLDIVMRADAVARVRLNDLLLEGADVLIHPDVEGRHWADFGSPRELFRRGETAALERLVSIRTAILRASQREKAEKPEARERTLAGHLRMIKDKILEKVTGKPGDGN